MSDLTEFLLARLAEDAERATDDLEAYTHSGARKYARRMLAECEAKRRIVTWHADWGPHTCPSGMNRYQPEPDESWIGCPELLTLAAVYSDHPDYDEAWRV